MRYSLRIGSEINMLIEMLAVGKLLYDGNKSLNMDAEALADLIRQCGGNAESSEDTDDAVKKAVEFAGDSGRVASLGSLYFSSDVRKSCAKLYPDKIIGR
jgi:folylpolyglutamate synthase/dihydropteroate synthase